MASITRQIDILQKIADKIDNNQYYSFFVEKKKDGFYLIPEEARHFYDEGEFMGETFEIAKVSIAEFVKDLI